MIRCDTPFTFMDRKGRSCDVPSHCSAKDFSFLVCKSQSAPSRAGVAQEIYSACHSISPAEYVAAKTHSTDFLSVRHSAWLQLYTKEFYETVIKAKLNPGGVFVTQSGPAGVLSSSQVWAAACILQKIDRVFVCMPPCCYLSSCQQQDKWQDFWTQKGE